MTHKNVLLLHDNVRMHSAAVTFEAIRQMKFELLAHPHIVQTWLHWVMFGPLKEMLHG
jgi:hypothetical protein